MLTTALVIFILLACIVLGFFVLIQNSKGGGLASNFASSNQIMGVRKTTDFLEKATWALAAFIMLLCLVVAFMTKSEFNSHRQDASTDSAPVEETVDE
jgi:preprotein translocase subunit SecG